MGETAATEYVRLLEGWGKAAEREQVMVLHGFALAYARQFDAAIAEAERALALERQLGLRNAYLPFICARIYVLAGKYDQGSSRRRYAGAITTRARGSASIRRSKRSETIQNSGSSYRKSFLSAPRRDLRVDRLRHLAG